MPRAASSLLLSALLLAAPGAAGSQGASGAGLVPARARAPVGRLADKLARAGLVDELEGVVELLRALGEDDAALARESARWRRQAAEVDRAPGAVARKALADAAREAAAALTAALAEAAEEDRAPLATAVLALDGDVAAAREVLGHERVDGAWAAPAEAALLRRRAELAARREAARALEVEVTVGGSDDPTFAAFAGSDARLLRAPGMAVHTDLAPEVAVPVVREVVRASAYSNYVRTGRLAPPRSRRDATFVLLAEPARLAAFVDVLVAAGRLAPQSRSLLAQDVEYVVTADRTRVGGWFSLAGFQAQALLDLWTKDVGTNVQPTFTAGHVNGVCTAFFGHPCPPIFATFGGSGGRTTTGGAARAGIPLDAATWRLVSGSLPASRGELEERARRGQDPPWIDSLEPASGLITDLDMLKSTWVVAWLEEQGRFGRVLEKSRSGDRGPRPIETALGENLARFEREWRRWLLGEPGGLAQRLTAGSGR